MKVNRTYSMDLSLVMELAKKKNQSLEVCKAVRKHLNDGDEFDLRDIETIQLLIALRTRFDIGSVQRNLIDSIISLIRD